MDKEGGEGGRCSKYIYVCVCACVYVGKLNHSLSSTAPLALQLIDCQLLLLPLAPSLSHLSLSLSLTALLTREYIS